MCIPIDELGVLDDRGDLGGSSGAEFGKPCTE